MTPFIEFLELLESKNPYDVDVWQCTCCKPSNVEVMDPSSYDEVISKGKPTGSTLI